jgi:hypothetical protein
MIMDQHKINALQQLIDENGYSLNDVGKLAGGVTHTTVRRWLAGGNIKKKYWDELNIHLQDTLESTVPPEVQDAYQLLKQIKNNRHLIWLITTNIRTTVSAFNDAVNEAKPNKPPIPYTNGAAINRALGPQNTDGIPAAAGHGNIEQLVKLKITEAESMNYEGVFVDGESMEPTFKNGDRVWLKPTPKPLHLPAVEKPKVNVNTIRTWIKDSSIIMCDLNQQGRMLKRIHYFEEKGKWTVFLSSDNEEWGKDNGFPHVVTRDDDLIIYGEVIAKTLI